eukprot:1159718-Pelagomonas_calceolata.AAC.3
MFLKRAFLKLSRNVEYHGKRACASPCVILYAHQLAHASGAGQLHTLYYVSYHCAMFQVLGRKKLYAWHVCMGLADTTREPYVACRLPFFMCLTHLVLAARRGPATRLAAALVALPGPQLVVLEGQLTWLVYIIGSIIKGRLSSSSAESQIRWLITKGRLSSSGADSAAATQKARWGLVWRHEGLPCSSKVVLYQGQAELQRQQQDGGLRVGMSSNRAACDIAKLRKTSLLAKVDSERMNVTLLIFPLE